MTRQTMTMTAASVLLASLALAGCNKPNDNTATVQPTVSETVSKGVQETKEATKEAAQDVKDATKSASDQASNKIADAVITTAVNAELAKDSKLSALRINVDTDGGRVVLHGTAPDKASKERATQLATSVKGVVSVDNQLTIDSKG